MTNFFKQFINSKGEKLNEGTATEGHFFTPNGYVGRRLKDTNLTNVNAVFADWDFKPLDGATTGSAKPDYKQFRLDLDGLPEPTYVIESGNGWHLYWMLDETVEVDDDNRAEMILLVEGIQRHIHKNYGSDGGAIDALRLMRYPGYEHKKQPEHPFMVEVVEETDSRYTLDELKELLPPVLKEAVDMAEPDETEHFDIRKVAVDVWASKGQVVSFDPTGRLLWGEEKTATGTFIGRHGSCNYIATTSDDYPYKGNPTTYAAGVMGVTNKQAWGWLCDTYGKPAVPAPEGEGAPDEVTIEERDAYLSYLAEVDWDEPVMVKKLKMLESAYVNNFHKYLALLHPHLLFEIGEDKSYFNYDTDTGVYNYVNFSTVRGLVIKLLIAEGLEGRATESGVKNIVNRYRGIYVGRGVTLDSFVAPDGLFAMNNGWLNLKTLELSELTPDIKCLFKSAVDYDPEATCPTWDKLMDEDLQMPQDQVRVIDQFGGYLLTNDISKHKALMFDGRTGAGKSTIPMIWRHILGDLAVQASLTSLDGGEVRFMGDMFAHKHLCFFDEANPKTKNINEYFQNLITNEHIKVERKGIQEKASVRNTMKVVVALNEMPDHMPTGMKRRYTHINFTRSFTEEGIEDTELPARIIATELSGVFNRMLRGLADLTLMRGFTMIEGEADRRREYDLASDDFAGFLADNFDPVRKDATVRYTGQELMEAFQAAYPKGYNKQLHVRGFNKKLLATRLPEFSHIKFAKGSKVKGYQGIRLKSDKYLYSENDSHGDGKHCVIKDSIARVDDY